ncbi:SprT family zinc-dependent metalloprotease [Paenibacillus macerans]|uniref:M48 family metallopeptidase n=1 Tax=Paenibacillus macerans TaxID=44252 RepID=UPI002E1DE987|nr:SprT family zinc-dependent metalloprotease [Paenibacillus macerans]
MQIIISGIAVEVCKKNIKNMHLYVKPPSGKVSVSAPIDMSDEAIERFVRTKSSWIKQQVKNFEAQPRQTEREYVSGETLYVWGKQYFLQVEYGTGKNSLVLSGDKAILTVRKDSTKEQRDSFVKEWYRDLLKRELARLLPKWENITGLKCDGWQTKYMTTRWGTCNTDKRKLWFNLQLAKKTPDCLEYIILHELLHLVERNHNAHFLSLMDKYMPYWRETKRKLNGQILDFME